MDIAISLDRLCYFPGDVVRCLVQVAHVAADPTAELPISNVQLTVECGGTERVDPSWVANLYRPDVPAVKEGKVGGVGRVERRERRKDAATRGGGGDSGGKQRCSPKQTRSPPPHPPPTRPANHKPNNTKAPGAPRL